MFRRLKQTGRVGMAFFAHAVSDRLPHHVALSPRPHSQCQLFFHGGRLSTAADFSIRWMMIKRTVSLACRESHHRTDWMTASKRKHRESTIWQRRFWEHQIRDEHDFVRHADYIHFNPVKHGCARRVAEWPYSTFHRYVRDGVYSQDWSAAGDEEVLE